MRRNARVWGLVLLGATWLGVALFATMAEAAYAPTQRSNIRRVERKRVVERNMEGFVTFRFAPPDGTGLPSIGELCSAYSSEMTGSYWCMNSDGTSLAGGLTLTGVSSPTTPSVITCPNGPDCAAATYQRLNGSSQSFETSSVAGAAGNFSVCLALNTRLAAHTASAVVIGRDAGGATAGFRIQATAGAYTAGVIKAGGASTTSVAMNVVPGALNFFCATYQYVADGSSIFTPYLDGAVGTPSAVAVGPMNATAGKWTIGRRDIGGSPLFADMDVRTAFFTEKVLTAAVIAAMSRTALADRPQSLQGHLLPMTRGSAKFCANAAQSAGTLLGYNVTSLAARECIRNGGIEVEGQSINKALRSDALDTGAVWAPGAITVSNPTVTANLDTAPDGTLAAEEIAYPQVVGAGAVSQIDSGFTATAAPHSLSVYLRRASGTSTIYLWLRDTGATTWYSSACAVTTTWSRCTVINKTLTAATWRIGLGVDLRDGTQSTQAAQTVYAWGVQAEAKAAVTSYIATLGTTVTRSPEALAVLMPPVNPAEGCARLTLVPSWTGSPPDSVNLLSFNTANTARISAINSGFDGIYINDQVSDAQAATATNITFTAGTPVTTRSTWSVAANLKRLSFTPGSPTVATKSFTAFALDASMLLGYSTGLVHVGGVLRDVSIGTNPNLCGATP